MRARALDDGVEVRVLGVEVLVEVQVDRLAVALGHRERQVEQFQRPVAMVRIQAHDICAQAHRFFQPLAGRRAGLRPAAGEESHHLQPHPVARALAQGNERLDAAQLCLRIDVGVRADRHRAALEAGCDRSLSTGGDVLDAHALGVAGKGRNRAHERAFGILHCAQRARLVEMLVRVDQPRDDEPAFDVYAFDAGTRFDCGRNAFDTAAVADQEIDRPIMAGDTGAAKEQG